jgi:hypothetical protein
LLKESPLVLAQGVSRWSVFLSIYLGLLTHFAFLLAVDPDRLPHFR